MPPKMIHLTSHAGYLFALDSDGRLWAAYVSIAHPQDIKWYPVTTPEGQK